MKENNNLSPKNWSHLLKFFTAFLAIIMVAIIVVVVWANYFSPEARYAREVEKNYQKYLDYEKDYEEAMKNDTYGGKTPEETLALFVDALKKEDIDLASKYFLIDDKNSQETWRKALEEKKNADKLQDIINLIEKARPAGSAMENYFGFEIRDDKNQLLHDINMILNKYNKIWKIESL